MSQSEWGRESWGATSPAGCSIDHNGCPAPATSLETMESANPLLFMDCGASRTRSRLGSRWVWTGQRTVAGLIPWAVARGGLTGGPFAGCGSRRVRVDLWMRVKRLMVTLQYTYGEWHGQPQVLVQVWGLVVSRHAQASSSRGRCQVQGAQGQCSSGTCSCVNLPDT